MINILKTAFILLFLAITIGGIAFKPSMHKTVAIGDLQYIVAPPAQKTETVKIQPQPITQATQKVQSPQKTQQQVIIQVIEEHVASQPKVVKTTPDQKTTTVTSQNNNSELIHRVIKNAEQQSSQMVTVTPQTQQHVTPVQSVKITDKPLTEAEEIIAWNKWRSDLQNQVMKDSRIYAPVGTRFNFTFTVDKNGNISNINTWSDNNYYTPTAKRVIKPILMSYQHTAILKFPARTKRTIVNVEGGYTMSTTERYSTPGDYNDYERIKR